MAGNEMQRLLSTRKCGSNSSDVGSGLTFCVGLPARGETASTETLSRLQASPTGETTTAAGGHHNEAAAAPAASRTAHIVGATTEITEVAASRPGDAEEGPEMFVPTGNCGSRHVCEGGQHRDAALTATIGGSNCWTLEGFVQRQAAAFATVEAEGPLWTICSNRAVASVAEAVSSAASPVIEKSAADAPDRALRRENSLEATVASLSGGSDVSAGASARLAERAYHVAEAYRGDSGAGAVHGLPVRALEAYTEDHSTAAAEGEAIGTESACGDSTNSSASDCCGCVGQGGEASVRGAAGVPPYLRIDSLPAVLEEGTGGHVCVLLGQKKEALLYSVATPFGLNKCVLVCVYMLYAFLTGCVYFGWPSLSYMLLTSGAYSWLCPKDSNGEFINDLRKPQNRSEEVEDASRDKGGKYYICDEQDAAVAPLFTIAYVTQSLMSVVAGTLLDHVSPKRAAMLGQLLNAVGWTLLACSSYTFQAYIPAMVFIGLGADTAYLPTLLIAALFPGKRAIVITLLGSANTSSFAVPMLLELFWKWKPDWSFSQICWLYMGVGPCFCCCIAAFFIPRSSFSSAALRRLSLQQQQSPLHGSKEDAFLEAEQNHAKKRSSTGKWTHSERGCCRDVGVSEQPHTCRSSHSRMYAHCCCCDGEGGPRSIETVTLCRKQRLRRFFPAPLRLLQRVSSVRFCCRPIEEQQSRVHAASPQQQPPPPDSAVQQAPSSNTYDLDPGDCTKCECCQRVEASAASDLLTVCAAGLDDTAAITDTDRGRRASIAAGNAETPGVRWAGRSGNSEENSRGPCADIIATSRGAVFHVGEDASSLNENVRCCDRWSALGKPTGRLHTANDCRCNGAFFTASAAVQEQQPSFVSVSHDSNAVETPVGRTASPQLCEEYMLSQLAALAEEGSTHEKDAGDFASNCFVDPKPREEASLADTIEAEDEDGEEPSFCSQLFSSHFMCIVLYWSGMAVAISYFQSASSRLLSTKALGFMDVALSFSFVPCVLLGYMIDSFGPFPALFLVNTMGVVTYCFALAAGTEQNMLQYVSILAFCVYVSVDSEQVFCYVENTFSSKHFGKLSGLALTAGGVISLVSIPLYDEVTIGLLKKNPLPVCLGLMVVLILLYFTLGSMWSLRLKHPPAFKARKKQKKQSVTAAPTSAEANSTALAATESRAATVEERKTEEVYALHDDDVVAVEGLPGCLCRGHTQCCLCCSGCASGSRSSARKLCAACNSDGGVWRGPEVSGTNVENNGTSERPLAGISWLGKPLRGLLLTHRSRAREVEVLHQPQESERQQQQRRASTMGKEEGHLRVSVV